MATNRGWPLFHLALSDVPLQFGGGDYIRASDNGPSEKRTTSLQRTSSVLQIEMSIVVILNQPPRSGRFLIPDNGQDSNFQRDFAIQIASNVTDTQETTPLKLYHAHSDRCTVRGRCS